MWWTCNSALTSGNTRARHSDKRMPTLDHALPVGLHEAGSWCPHTRFPQMGDTAISIEGSGLRSRVLTRQ